IPIKHPVASSRYGQALRRTTPFSETRPRGTMATAHEAFWNHSSYAFVGHSSAKGFPALSYGEAKKRGKKVFAVDASVERIAGDKTYPDLRALPEPVEGVVLEVPREETADWVRQAARAGIKNVWIHMNRETPEAL